MSSTRRSYSRFGIGMNNGWRIAFIIPALLLCSVSANAQWQKVLDLGFPFDCGCAIDAKTFLIGSGGGVNGTDLQCTPSVIYKSIDGGTNWHATATPNGILGSVTSIFMLDAMTGYASLTNCTSSPSSALWQTKDGGETWTDLSNAVYGNATCVAATSKAIVLTEWLDVGGSSTDGGLTFSHVFASATERLSNGVAFTDDNTGVATMLQHPSVGLSSPFWYTSDGGITWQPSSVQTEAWSVYGRKCSQSFFCASEGELANPNQTIFMSSDGGRTWAPRYTFADSTTRFTGHIAGADRTLYIETDATANRGLLRSDDLGLSWKPVGGPSAARDTRFIVAGSAGEIVIAFDQAGGVWRTMNGGDGTLLPSIGSTRSFSVSSDSLEFHARSCAPDTITLFLENGSCGAITIDSAVLGPNAFGEYTLGLKDSLLQSSDRGPLEVQFVPKNAPNHSSSIHLYAHSLTATFDTIVTLGGVNLTPLVAHFGPAITAQIGDTIDVPISLDQTFDPFVLSKLQLDLGFDGDMLTPVGFTTANTLAQGSSATFATPMLSGKATVLLNFSTPLTQSTTDFTKPLIIIRMLVTLAKQSNTDVTLNTVALNNTAAFAPCSVTSLPVDAKLRCGDSTIKTFLGGVPIGTLLSASPNPMGHSIEDVRYVLGTAGSVSLEIVDVSGVTILKTPAHELEAGEHALQFDGRELPSGAYTLRLLINDIPVSTLKLVQAR